MEGNQLSTITFQFNTFKDYQLLQNKAQLLTLTFTVLHVLSSSVHSNIIPTTVFHILSIEPKWKYFFPQISLYLLDKWL